TELLTGRAISRAGWTLNPVWSRPIKIARTLLVFSLMTFAFIFFRGENLPQTLSVIGRLFSGWGILTTTPTAIASEFLQTGYRLACFPLAIALIGVVLTVQFLQARGPLRPRIAALPTWLRWGFYYAGVTVMLVLADHQSAPFIYFRF